MGTGQEERKKKAKETKEEITGSHPPTLICPSFQRSLGTKSIPLSALVFAMDWKPIETPPALY